MKKLKKVLSLVLVLAMALSVFGVCASAANVEDYADADSITYTEAVGVLSGLGVLEGDENGFRPADTLTRAEAAKIASYLIGLQDEVVQGPSFSDVEGNWAAGYIAICESQELVHGNGDGTFTPDGTLTGYEWEKMVLCALGYDATIEKMVGDSWQGGVANLAKKTGLLDGLSSDYKAANEITREQAAQIAFNALFTQTVVYPHTTDKIAGFGDKKLGELVFNLDVKNTFDVFGAPVAKVYYNTKTKDAYASFAIDPIAEYDNEAAKVSITEINDDLKDDLKVKDAVSKYYVDGTSLELPDGKIGGRGVEVDVYNYTTDYTTKTTETRVVVINTYVAELTKDSIVPGTKNTNGVTTPDTVTGLEKSAYLEAGTLKAGDIITYNVGSTKNTIGAAGKTVAVNAEVKTPAGLTSKIVSFDGTQAKAVQNGYVVFAEGDNDKEYFDVNAKYGKICAQHDSRLTVDQYYGVVYDNYDNIIYIFEAERETVSTKGHLFLIDAISYYDEDQYVVPGGLYTPIKESEADAQALVILYTDDTASVEVVDLAIAQKANGEYALVNKYGFVDGNAQSFDIGVNPIDVELQEGFVEYYVNEDGEYIITKCDDHREDGVSTTKGDKEINDNATQAKRTLASNTTKLTYLTATIDPYTVLTKDSIAAVAKSITVSAKTVVGYDNFLNFECDDCGYLEVDQKTGLATVGATIGVELVKNTYTYAMFKTTKEAVSKVGEVYTFIGSDGKEVDYTPAVAKSNENAESGLTNVTKTSNLGFTPNAVYKLALNSKGELVAYKELTGEAVEATHVTHVDWAAGTGYLKGNTGVAADGHKDSASTEKYFYTGFGGKAIDGTKAVDVTTLAAKNTYVKVYLDDADKEPVGPADNEIVFVTVEADKAAKNVDGEAVEGLILKKGGDGNYFFQSADGKVTKGFYNNAYVGETAIASGNLDLYVGKTFTYTYQYDVNCAGTADAAKNEKFTTTADDFWVVDANFDTLTNVKIAAEGGKTEYTLLTTRNLKCTENGATILYFAVDNNDPSTLHAVTAADVADTAHYTLKNGYSNCGVSSHFTIGVYNHTTADAE